MRPDWHTYFMGMSRHASTRATCPRKSVGCILVDMGRQIIATGYNGSLPHMPHCTDVGCLMEDGHCVRTTHAEVNAIACAAKRGVRVEYATAYLTTFPCWPCFKLLVTAGVFGVYYDEAYRPSPHVLDYASRKKFPLLQVSNA